MSMIAKTARKAKESLETISNKIKKTINNKYQSEDGKMMEPKTFSLIFKRVLPIVLVGSLTIRSLTRKNDRSAFNKYTTENAPKVEVGKAVVVDKRGVDDYIRQAEETAQLDSRKNSASFETKKKEPPSPYEIANIVEKAKNGGILTDSERAVLASAAESDSFTKEQREQFKQMSDPKLSSEEAKNIANSVDMNAKNGTTTATTAVTTATDTSIRPEFSDAKKDENKLALKIIEENNNALKIREQALKEASDVAAKASSKGAPPAVQTKIDDEKKKLSELNEKYLKASEEARTVISDQIEASVDKINDSISDDKSKTEIENKKRKLAEANSNLEEKKSELVKYKAKYGISAVAAISMMNAESSVMEGSSRIIREEEKPKLVRKLTPEEYRILSLLKAGKDMRKEESVAKESAAYEVANSVIFTNDIKKGFSLHPSMKLALVLDDDIVCSEENFGEQNVYFTVLNDSVNPITKQMDVTKNSKLSGKISNFDKQTETITITITSLMAGPVIHQIGGSVSIRGRMRSARAKQITGAILTDWISSITDKIKNDAKSNLTASGETPTLLETLNTANVGLGASAAEKVANYLAADLQNAKYIFYAPKGIPSIFKP